MSDAAAPTATPRPFVHLHCHSHYSLLDGAGAIEKLVERAKSHGMNALAITDHGNLHGALEVYKKCKDAGINPIIGYEAYIAPDSRFTKDAGSMKEASYHLTLLAQNRTGFKNLVKMASSAFSLTLMVPADGFAVTKGDTVIGGAHGPDLHHNFCPHCMTWMFTRIEGVDWFVNVRPTMFDDLGWFARPFMETYCSTKLPFAETGALRSFDTFPAMDELEGLLRDYAAWAGASSPSPLVGEGA